MNKKSIIELALVVLVVLAVAAMVILHARNTAPAPLPVVTPQPTPRVIVEEREVEKIVEKIVETEKEITVEEINSGLQAMGRLITGKYFFSDVIQFSSSKKLFQRWEIGLTKSHYLAGYDGIVTAGVDFGRIRVEKDEQAQQIRVTLPPAEIFSVDIDMESFRLFSEKSGLGNPISLEDMNTSLVTLEHKARERAEELGLPETAAQNAQELIRSFILQLMEDGYTLVLKEEET